MASNCEYERIVNSFVDLATADIVKKVAEEVTSMSAIMPQSYIEIVGAILSSSEIRSVIRSLESSFGISLDHILESIEEGLDEIPEDPISALFSSLSGEEKAVAVSIFNVFVSESKRIDGYTRAGQSRISRSMIAMAILAIMIAREILSAISWNTLNINVLFLLIAISLYKISSYYLDEALDILGDVGAELVSDASRVKSEADALLPFVGELRKMYALTLQIRVLSERLRSEIGNRGVYERNPGEYVRLIMDKLKKLRRKVCEMSEQSISGISWARFESFVKSVNKFIESIQNFIIAYSEWYLLHRITSLLGKVCRDISTRISSGEYGLDLISGWTNRILNDVIVPLENSAGTSGDVSAANVVKTRLISPAICSYILGLEVTAPIVVEASRGAMMMSFGYKQPRNPRALPAVLASSITIGSNLAQNVMRINSRVSSIDSIISSILRRAREDTRMANKSFFPEDSQARKLMAAGARIADFLKNKVNMRKFSSYIGQDIEKMSSVEFIVETVLRFIGIGPDRLSPDIFLASLSASLDIDSISRCATALARWYESKMSSSDDSESTIENSASHVEDMVSSNLSSMKTYLMSLKEALWYLA